MIAPALHLLRKMETSNGACPMCNEPEGGRHALTCALAKEIRRLNVIQSRFPRRVVLESPFSGANGKTDAEKAALAALHRAYALAALKDCHKRGEAATASHLLHTQVLDDGDPHERQQGILAGHAWTPTADCVAVYLDMGISRGMEIGILEAGRFEVPTEHRRLLPADLLRVFLSVGEFPELDARCESALSDFVEFVPRGDRKRPFACAACGKRILVLPESEQGQRILAEQFLRHPKCASDPIRYYV